MVSKKQTLLGGIAGAALAVAAAVAPASAETVKIGSTLPVTGPASFLGDPELKTLNHYIEKVNANGGVDGVELEFVHYDDGGNPKNAVTFAKRLIEQDEVDVIIGPGTTGTTMAIAKIVRRAGVPTVSLGGATVITRPTKEWIFATPHTDRMACGKIFTDLEDRGLTGVALISGTGGFGKSMRNQCLELAPEYGLEVLADETYGPKDTDMTTQLTKIKNTDGVDAVVNPGFGQGPAIVTKNYRQLGLEQPLYQSHGVASKKFIELAGDAANGVRLPAAALLVADQLPEDDPQKPVVVNYKNTFEEATGDPVSTFGGHAYDGLMLVVEAIKAGARDRASIRDALENVSGYVGTGGVVNMGPDDHLGLELTAFQMLEIENGDWKIIE